MNREWKAIANRASAYSSYFFIILLILPYQNCGNQGFKVERYSSSTDSSDPAETNSEGNPISSSPPMVSNPEHYGKPNLKAPSLNGDFSARTLRSGMGSLAGDTRITIPVEVSPGGGEEAYQQVAFSTCTSSSNIIGITCSGTDARIVIAPDRDRDCRSGPVDITLQLQDVMDPSLYPDNEMPEPRYSEQHSIRINVEDACLPEQQVLADDGQSQDQLGGQVAIDGTTAVAISGFHDSAAANAGAAYVYRFTNGRWAFVNKITLPEAGEQENLSAVDVRGDLLALGSPYHNGFEGAVYLYQRSGSSWSLLRKLPSPVSGQSTQFGFSVRISPDGQWLAVGAPGEASNAGAAYLYRLVDNAVTPTHRLSASDGSSFDEFGTDLAMENGSIVIGAPVNILFSPNRIGKAYVFESSGGNWTEFRLPHQDVNKGARLGTSVAISGQRVAVGAPLEANDTRLQAGKVYIYDRMASGWGHTSTVAHRDVRAGDEFGVSVALAGDRLLVGAHRHTIDGNSRQGTAYLFDRSGTNWNLTWKLMARNGEARDFFGGAVRMSNGEAMIGSRNSSPKGDNSGSAYLIELP